MVQRKRISMKEMKNLRIVATSNYSPSIIGLLVVLIGHPSQDWRELVLWWTSTQLRGLVPMNGRRGTRIWLLLLINWFRRVEGRRFWSGFISILTQCNSPSLSCEQRAKEAVQNAFKKSDTTQRKSTNLLATRTRTVDQWRGTLERAITAQMEEISLLEEQRQRLKKSLLMLHKPYSIGRVERKRSKQSFKWTKLND